MKNNYVIGLCIVAVLSILTYRIFSFANETNTNNNSTEKNLLSDSLKENITTNKEAKKTTQSSKPQNHHGQFVSQVNEPNADTLFSPYSQKEEPWQTLMEAKYRNWGGSFVPLFEEKQRKLHNKPLTIKGFMYPLEESNTHKVFVLSFYPVSSCFFCGAAGPESVVEIQMKKPLKVYTKRITLTGTLLLNDKDSERLFYILQDAELK